MSDRNLYWTLWEPQGLKESRVFLMASGEGLCRITWPLEGFGALELWRDKHLPSAGLIEDSGRLQPVVAQLQEYWNGERDRFTLPLDLRGTEFQRQVWQALQQIPYGKTISYTELAARTGRPTAMRAAGAANGSNPVPLIVPCHRVIGKNGKLTGFRGGLPMKERLLKLEGVQP